ncbi:MAG: hypothetical protein ACYC8T_05770 [Myxococcaceae bacterium]
MGEQKVENSNGIFVLERTCHIYSLGYYGRGHDRVETRNYDMVLVEGSLSRGFRERLLKHEHLDSILNGHASSALPAGSFVGSYGINFSEAEVYWVDDFDYNPDEIVGDPRTWLDGPLGAALIVAGVYSSRKLKSSSGALKSSRREFLRKACGSTVFVGAAVLAQSSVVPGVLFEVFGDYPDFVQDYHNHKQRVLDSATINQRNVIIAAKANQIAKDYKKRRGRKPKVVMKYGLAHGGILRYLENPGLAEDEIGRFEDLAGRPLRNYVLKVSPPDEGPLSRGGEHDSRYRLSFVVVEAFR